MCFADVLVHTTTFTAPLPTAVQLLQREVPNSFHCKLVFLSPLLLGHIESDYICSQICSLCRRQACVLSFSR